LLARTSYGTTIAVRGFTFISWLLAGFVVVGACNQPASDDDVNGFFDRRTRVICQKNFECCTGSSLLASSVESCIESDRLYYVRQQVATALREGRGSFDTKAGSDCLDAIAALDCDGWAGAIAGADPAACRSVIKGEGRDGASCTTDYECAALYCDKPAQSNTGVCKPKGPVGATCVTGQPSCVEGVACLSPGTCTARKVPGDACSRGGECQSGFCDGGSCAPVCWGEVLAAELFGI
jgi:hypothetical protein